MRISKQARSLPGSKVREIFDRANALELQGERIIHLEIGRPWFDTPAAVKEAARAALSRGEVHYSPNKGIAELRAAISKKLKRENDIEVDADSEILITCGNKQATFLAMNAVVDPGDEVVLTDPHYGPHVKQALFVGATPRLVPLSADNNWRLNPESLMGVVSSRSRLLVVNTPHNPTGRVFSREELEAIASCAVDNNMVVLTDETYEYFVYDDAEHLSIASFPRMRDRTISTFAFTKSYAMDGWRLGYAVAPPSLITAMTRIVQLDTGCANTFAQFGAVEAAKSGVEGAREMVAEDARARDLALHRLRLMGLICPPVEGTIYAFPDVGRLGLDGDEFARRLLEDCGVAVTPGSAYGDQARTHVRIAFGAVPRELLTEALDRVERFIESVNR